MGEDPQITQIKEEFELIVIKRLFDLMAAISSLIILSPVLIGILVRLKIGSPVLFRQVRPGLNSRPFTIYKFHTMTDERVRMGICCRTGKD